MLQKISISNKCCFFELSNEYWERNGQFLQKY